jgi:DeoR family fructose operon transcriptional repressor
MSGFGRRGEILRILMENNSVSVAELSGHFRVSAMTIRRDLDVLAREGRIVRTHGGALLARDLVSEISFFERKGRNLAEKLAMARASLPLIHDGDSLFLDSSTTCLALAALLPEEWNLSVVTNGLHTALRLSEKKGISTILIGGVVREGFFSTIGPETETRIKEFRARAAVISATAFDPEQGAFEANLLEAEVKRTMIRSSHKVILLVDSSKWGQVALNKTADTEMLKAVVADDAVPAPLAEAVRAKGIQLVLAAGREEDSG